MSLRTVTMKLLLLVVGLVAAGSAELVGELWEDYHQEVGIPELERIKQAEAAADFDGSRIVGGQVSNVGQHPHLVS